MMQWDLPGPDRFLDTIAESLYEGKHVIVVLPETVRQADPISPLRRKIRDFGYGDLAAQHSGNDGDDLFDVLSDALGCRDTAVSTYHELLNYPESPARVLVFDLWGKERTPAMKKWVRLLVLAAEHAKEYGGGCYQLLIIVGPGAALPSGDLYLVHHYWWGVLSAADIDWVVEWGLEQRPPATTGEQYWIRTLCRGLCGNDIPLAGRFIEEMPTTIDEAISILQEYGESSQELFEGPLEYGQLIVPYGRKVPPPPCDPHWLELWKGGWIDWVKGRGRVLHSSVLAVKEERAEICRRVWIAQQELILPLVERIRLLIIEWLERVFGSDWINVMTSNLNLEDRNNLETEIGPLAYHVFHKSRTKSFPNYSTVATLVWSWWEIRNGLAHGKYVTLGTLENAWSAYDQFVRRCI